jgi:hypothetical protein
MGVPYMDKACLGAVLVSRTRDETSKDAVVSVDVVHDGDGLLGRALRECLGNGHDGATRLRHDKRSETQGLGTDGRSTYQKPHQVAELVVNTQKDELLDDHTWRNLVWRDMVKNQLRLKDHLGQLEVDKGVNRVQFPKTRNTLTRSFIRV